MQCPSCHNEVPLTEQQFGALYTCAVCGGVYFVNFDGQPEFDSQAMPNQPSGLPKMDISETDALQFQADFQIPSSAEAPTGNVLQDALNNIEAYGNRSVDVHLSFDLTIEGLETKEIMSRFYDSINDPKFGWRPDEIMNSIKNGRCELLDLKPVFAHVIAKRLQFVDIVLHWRPKHEI